MPASYFLGTRLLAVSNTQPPGEEASYALFCFRCGEVWGRVLITSKNPHYKWRVSERLCGKHRTECTENDDAGSFIPLWRAGCPAELPPEVLRYELSIRLDKLQGADQS